MANVEKVAYMGILYTDADKVARGAGRSLQDVVSSSFNTGVKNIAEVKARKKEWADALKARGSASNIDGYMSTKKSYTAFCNAFFLDSSKYLIDLEEVFRTPPAAPTPAPAQDFGQIGDLLDAILQEEQEQTKTLHAILQAFNTVCGTISLNVEASRETLQRMGPKLGEIDKKIKNIEINTATVSKTWPGHVSNTAGIKSTFDRYVAR